MTRMDRINILTAELRDLHGDGRPRPIAGWPSTLHRISLDEYDSRIGRPSAAANEQWKMENGDVQYRPARCTGPPRWTAGPSTPAPMTVPTTKQPQHDRLGQPEELADLERPFKRADYRHDQHRVEAQRKNHDPSSARR
jgi:hypothetical protein